MFTAILTLLTLMAIVSAGSDGDVWPSIGTVIAGLICPGIFAIVPGILLWESRRGSRGGATRQQVVKSHAVTSGYSDLTISSDQVLPKICVRCGSATRRATPLRYENGYTEANPYDWNRAGPFLLLAMVFNFITALLVFSRIWQSVEKRWKRRQAGQDDVVFHIPHCRSCRKRHPIVQRQFDFHARKMMLEVHPNFREGRVPRPAKGTPQPPTDGPGDW